MTYEEALSYLASLGKFGMNLGLARIEKLLELMGHPERQYKTVHITGTNGKGSTAAMLAAVLRAAGLRTGLYTSPHLVEYTERMTVNGAPVSREAFAGAVEHTAALVAEMVAGGWEHPTEFEVLTAAAFHYFAAEGLEYAVIEVGLGGLLDSTNVIIPEVSVITNVTLEHTDRCGGTVAEIAGHKAGIIKPGVPVVTAARGEALAVLRETAARNDAPLYVLGRDFSADLIGFEACCQQIAVVTGRYGDLGQFGMNLLGRHQAENGAVAVMAALLLAEKEPRITLPRVRQGLAGAYWPGRFEVVPGRPVTVIDGAHNPDGAARLRAALDEFFAGRSVVFVLGILADKDIDAITGTLIRPSDYVVAVRPPSERAADPSAVAARIGAGRVETAATVAGGLSRAREMAGPDGLVCIAGSLYLIGAARPLIIQ
ncbi:MAG TPA: folylpolyglutamate synthase/dihydrofolate synthase family protein [Selenomonadales bacterium]|nr:folylpolyglutamate synthase/dihydrofolate synthase family protein [Selenomonadales bacterium]